MAGALCVMNQTGSGLDPDTVSDPIWVRMETQMTSDVPVHGLDADSPRADGMVTDPVCGMTVDATKTAHHADHEGHR